MYISLHMERNVVSAEHFQVDGVTEWPLSGTRYCLYVPLQRTCIIRVRLMPRSPMYQNDKIVYFWCYTCKDVSSVDRRVSAWFVHGCSSAPAISIHKRGHQQVHAAVRDACEMAR